jgi:hypothetical protein
MKFIGILLKEGRREDLKKKYSTKFNEQDLEFIRKARAEIFTGLKVFYNSSW